MVEELSITKLHTPDLPEITLIAVPATFVQNLKLKENGDGRRCGFADIVSEMHAQHEIAAI